MAAAGKHAPDRGTTTMTDPLPLRLHRAVSILSRSGDPGAADAQAACVETTARIVQLEEALAALLNGVENADEQVLRILATR